MTEPDISFDNKTFKVVRNDGPDAEVTTETVFHFREEPAITDGTAIVHADYSGGKVRLGKLIGVVSADRRALRHSYVQVNLAGGINSGAGTVEVRLTPKGKIQLTDSWEWKSGKGSGVMEEV